MRGVRPVALAAVTATILAAAAYAQTLIQYTAITMETGTDFTEFLPHPSNGEVWGVDKGKDRIVVLSGGALAATIAVGDRPTGGAFLQDGTKFIVVNRTTMSLSVVDVSSRTVTSTIALPVIGSSDDPSDVAPNADGTFAYVSPGTGNGWIVDLRNSTTASETTNTHGGTTGATMHYLHAFGDSIYECCAGGSPDNVTMFYLNSSGQFRKVRETEHGAIGANAQGFVLSADGTVFFQQAGDGTLSRVATAGSATDTSLFAILLQTNSSVHDYSHGGGIALGGDQRTLYVLDDEGLFLFDTATLASPDSFSVDPYKFAMNPGIAALSSDGAFLYGFHEDDTPTVIAIPLGAGGLPSAGSGGGGGDSARADTPVISFPNPFLPGAGGAVTIRAEASSDTAVGLPAIDEVRILTLGGREVARIQGGGATSVSWGGANASGLPVSSGVYVYVVRFTDGTFRTGRLTLVR